MKDVQQRGKFALFVDGVKLHATAKALGFDVDYKKLLEQFNSRGTLLRAFYYITVMEDLEYCPVRPLVDWLDYNGYTVVTKTIREFVDDIGRRRIKANMDIDLVVDAMDMAAYVDEVVLISGEANFRPLVAALQRRGIRVTIVSTAASEPPMVSDELRRQADEFVDLADLQAKLVRKTSAVRPDRPEHPAMPAERRRSPARPGIHVTGAPDSIPEAE
jgi:uncharacterized LabA/DUF88 family protein